MTSSGEINITTAYEKTKNLREVARNVPSDGIKLINGECLEELSHLKNSSVDMLLVDLPYGTTACAWDSIIDLDKLWKQLERVCKSNAAMVFTAQQPFTWKLCSSNPSAFKYELIWSKPNGTNPFAAKIMPMKRHENILVFYREMPIYNPQMEEGKPYVWNSVRSGGEAGGMANGSDKIENDGKRYPSSILKFKQERGLHPTQKPVALMEWLIKTYTSEGMTVLDCTMGSGTTGVAAKKTNRNFVGIELNADYFEIAKERIKELEV
jgi:site-specific DNA-methyltransferase (adenine-specific)